MKTHILTAKTIAEIAPPKMRAGNSWGFIDTINGYPVICLRWHRL
jgi:hypothetical protein